MRKFINYPKKQGRLDLAELIKFLAELEINEVLVEAGSILNGALLEAELVDEWIIYMASKILGDQSRGLFHLPGLNNLLDCEEMNFKDIRVVGKNLKFTVTN